MARGYAQEFFEGYIKPKGIKSFTHKDILRETDANCSYRVLQDLISYLEKMGYKLTEIFEERINKKNQKKKYKRYFIEAI